MTTVGESRETVLTEALTRTQIVMYAGAAGDFHPLHSDERFVREVVGMPGVFAHGMLTLGMTARAVTDWFGDGRMLTYGGRFAKPVWPGDRLVTTVTVTALSEADGHPTADLDVLTQNGDGDPVVTGYARVRLD